MFVYRDGKGTLHAVESKATAMSFGAGGTFVTIEGECEQGYPVILGKIIIDDGDGEVFVGRKSEGDMPLTECDIVLRRAVNKFLKGVGL